MHKALGLVNPCLCVWCFVPTGGLETAGCVYSAAQRLPAASRCMLPAYACSAMQCTHHVISVAQHQHLQQAPAAAQPSRQGPGLTTMHLWHCRRRCQLPATPLASAAASCGRLRWWSPSRQRGSALQWWWPRWPALRRGTQGTQAHRTRSPCSAEQAYGGCGDVGLQCLEGMRLAGGAC